MKYYRKALTFLILFYVSSYAAAQENDENILYFIKDIDVVVKGRTTPRAVIRCGGFAAGEELRGKNELDKYITEKTQHLMNNRSIENVDIEYTIEEETKERYGINLIINITDTRNFIIFPKPKYSSNSGLEPAVELHDYNFLGTLNLLEIELSYNLDEFHLNDSSKSMYSLYTESNIPFYAGNLDWNFGFMFFLGYVAGEKPSFGNSAVISNRIPFKKTSVILGFEQTIQSGEEYYLFEKQKHENIFEDITYMSSTPFIKWHIPLGFRILKFGELAFITELSAKSNYKIFGDDLGQRHGPILSSSSTIGFDNVNWRGNLRDGYKLTSVFSSDYNVYFNEWNNNVTLLFTVHKPVINFLGVSMRGRYKVWFNDTGNYLDKDRSESGNMLRGILDRSLISNSIVSFNFDMPIRVLRFLPSNWFNTEKLKYFNVEMYLSPITDVALADGRTLDLDGRFEKNLTFDFNCLLITSGVEILFFPLAWRSIFLRISIGLNLKEAIRLGTIPSGTGREIFMGIGHHY
jgi:hypothetical protein